jgi:hypothetical protein
MGDNIYLGDRNGVRTPMQWTPDRNAGFSRADPARLIQPRHHGPIYGYQAVNVEAQQSDQSSLLHWTRNMIALRKLFPGFRPRQPSGLGRASDSHGSCRESRRGRSACPGQSRACGALL